jgi:hypothetical protein
LASFNVHLSVGIISSGIAATTMLVAGLGSDRQVVVYFLLGAIGSLLPDVDSDSSIPVQIAFSFASIMLAFLVMFLFTGLFGSVAELFLVWVGTYLLFRWLVFELFTRLTVHRGAFHTIPAALLFGFLTTAISQRVFAYETFAAWMNGAFVCFGYLVHLTLDELYSVNLFGMHTKRSLGTALKLRSKTSWPATLYLYLATAVAFYATPPVEPVRDALVDKEVLEVIGTRLLPEKTWFVPHRPG